MRKGYEYCGMYVFTETTISNSPVPPLSRNIREGVIKERCPHCGNVIQLYGDLLFMKNIPLGYLGKYFAKNKNLDKKRNGSSKEIIQRKGFKINACC